MRNQLHASRIGANTSAHTESEDETTDIRHIGRAPSPATGKTGHENEVKKKRLPSGFFRVAGHPSGIWRKSRGMCTSRKEKTGTDFFQHNLRSFFVFSPLTAVAITTTRGKKKVRCFSWGAIHVALGTKSRVCPLCTFVPVPLNTNNKYFRPFITILSVNYERKKLAASLPDFLKQCHIID